MYYDNDKLNEIYRDTWPNLGWARMDRIKAGDTVKFVVQRKDANGEAKEVALQADIREEAESYIAIEAMASPTATQQKIRKAWEGR